tara:strand:- start:4780 stop:4932 length:153 start_codon:yes stop_codon:yes gene_type:complete
MRWFNWNIFFTIISVPMFIVLKLIVFIVYGFPLTAKICKLVFIFPPDFIL